jgi:hypothetical protein
MVVLPEACHCGAVARHLAVANKLAAHWVFESFVPREEAGVVNAPHKFHFVCALSGCEGWVSTRVGKVCSISMAAARRSPCLLEW